MSVGDEGCNARGRSGTGGIEGGRKSNRVRTKEGGGLYLLD